MSTYLFDLILIGMSVYVLVSAILGRGRLFQLDNLKEGMEEKFYSGARKFYLGLGTSRNPGAKKEIVKLPSHAFDFDSFEDEAPAGEENKA